MEELFIVTDKAKRPASSLGCCFYCQSKIGDSHKNECMLIKRKSKIIVTIEYERDYPASWDKDMINFLLNESSWCASNVLSDLESYFRTECMCSRAKFKTIDISQKRYLEEE